MTLLETYVTELSQDLAINSYSFDYIKERLDNLCAIAKNEGQREQINRHFDLVGRTIAEPEETENK